MTRVLRTPDERFADLPDFPFPPHYLEVPDPALGALRLHFIDEGPRDGPVVLCLHGEPSWSFLYRKMIRLFVAAGLRVLAPDLVGFGRSDKPSRREDYTYASHLRWLRSWFDALGPDEVTLVAQDWGGLLGLRLLADTPERFARVSLANTGLPTGDQRMPEGFRKWKRYSQEVPEFDAGLICSNFGRGNLSPAEIEAYRAPFPTQDFVAGARQFPLLVPDRPDDPASESNRAAWQVLMAWEKPMLLCFSDADPVTAGGDQPFLRLVPGTRGQPHRTLSGAHFIQEEDGEAWAQAVIQWIA